MQNKCAIPEIFRRLAVEMDIFNYLMPQYCMFLFNKFIEITSFEPYSVMSEGYS